MSARKKVGSVPLPFVPSVVPFFIVHGFFGSLLVYLQVLLKVMWRSVDDLVALLFLIFDGRPSFWATLEVCSKEKRKIGFSFKESSFLLVSLICLVFV